MRHANEFTCQLWRIDLVEREAEHQPVARVAGAERQLERRDVQLPAEVLDGSVVFRHRTDTQRGEAGLRAELRHDLLDRAEPAGLGHAGSLRRTERPVRVVLRDWPWSVSVSRARSWSSTTTMRRARPSGPCSPTEGSA